MRLSGGDTRPRVWCLPGVNRGLASLRRWGGLCCLGVAPAPVGAMPASSARSASPRLSAVISPGSINVVCSAGSVPSRRKLTRTSIAPAICRALVDGGVHRAVLQCLQRLRKCIEADDRNVDSGPAAASAAPKAMSSLAATMASTSGLACSACSVTVSP